MTSSDFYFVLFPQSDSTMKLYEERYGFLTKNIHHSNLGVDLITSQTKELFPNVSHGSVHIIDLDIKVFLMDSNRVSHGFLVAPRSSISKTPCRLANSIGVIDPDYRGNLMVALDVKNPFILERGTRLVQALSPHTLSTPFHFVSKKEDFPEGFFDTKRGEGGFGSTGK